MNLHQAKINPLTPEMLQNYVTDLHDLHILRGTPRSQNSNSAFISLIHHLAGFSNFKIPETKISCFK